MPSLLIDNAFSGGAPLLSGNAYSGQRSRTTAVTWLKAASSNSGIVYVGTSVGFTVNSGSYTLSGGGANDGWPLAPGDEIKLPPLDVVSGVNRVFLKCDAAASGGFARVHYQLF